MARRIVITSGKGGVGKTTIVSSLGIILSRMGYRVLLVDMDFGLNNLDVLMNIENKIVYDIIDIIEGRCTINQTIIQDFFENNLYVLPTTHSFCGTKFGSKELLRIITSIEKDFDYIIIDCPAGIDGGFKRAIECGGEHIIITTPHFSAIRDASKVINLLECVSPYLIINRARGDMMVDGEMLDIDSITNCLNAELIGVIPEDDGISKQLLFGGELNSSMASIKSIEMIAHNLVMGERDIYDCTKKYKGLFGTIRKNIKKRV